MADLKVTGQYDLATLKVHQGQTARLPVYTLVEIALVSAEPTGMLAYVSDANGGDGAVVYSHGPGAMMWFDVATNAAVA